MAKLTHAQRSLAARKGWRTRKEGRRNPYTRRESDSSVELRHEEDLPNITLERTHLAYGGKVIPSLLNLSSGRIRSRAQLSEFITALRHFASSLH